MTIRVSKQGSGESEKVYTMSDTTVGAVCQVLELMFGFILNDKATKTDVLVFLNKVKKSLKDAPDQVFKLIKNYEEKLKK